MAKAAVKKPPTKTEIFASLAEQTGLTKKDIAAVFEALAKEISKSVGKKGAGAFTIPGLCKIVRQHKAAQGKRQVRNPQTGEMIWSKPKPARNVIRVRALKALKDMV